MTFSADGGHVENLHNKCQPDRSKIDMHEEFVVKYWTRQLGVSRERLQEAVDKVGNAAAAVRKELAT
jgi:3-oxoacyl-[acyl-carrier-protein] synthase III